MKSEICRFNTKCDRDICNPEVCGGFIVSLNFDYAKYRQATGIVNKLPYIAPAYKEGIITALSKEL